MRGYVPSATRDAPASGLDLPCVSESRFRGKRNARCVCPVPTPRLFAEVGVRNGWGFPGKVLSMCELGKGSLRKGRGLALLGIETPERI